MIDRELLELAAKAAGLPLADWHDGGVDYLILAPDADWPRSLFSPLKDDGDAMRLAALLRFTVKVSDHEVEIFDVDGECLVSIPVFAQDTDNVSGTVRRAIVRAAAEIGKQK